MAAKETEVVKGRVLIVSYENWSIKMTLSAYGYLAQEVWVPIPDNAPNWFLEENVVFAAHVDTGTRWWTQPRADEWSDFERLEYYE